MKNKYSTMPQLVSSSASPYLLSFLYPLTATKHLSPNSQLGNYDQHQVHGSLSYLLSCLSGQLLESSQFQQPSIRLKIEPLVRLSLTFSLCCLGSRTSSNPSRLPSFTDFRPSTHPRVCNVYLHLGCFIRENQRRLPTSTNYQLRKIRP